MFGVIYLFVYFIFFIIIIDAIFRLVQLLRLLHRWWEVICGSEIAGEISARSHRDWGSADCSEEEIHFYN